MRIDDKNKVVVPDFVAEWFENVSEKELDGNDVFRIIQDVLKVGDGQSTWNDYDVDGKLVSWVEENEETFLKLIVNCTKGNGYEVVPQKYYWRKKKEHLAWFEEEIYLTRFKFSDNENFVYILGSKVGSLQMTEPEAFHLLQHDFDKFEKVECE